MCERKYQHTQHSLLTVTHRHSSSRLHSHSLSAFTFTLGNHVHTQLGRQPATSFNSTGNWIYERTALRPVERRGHSVDTQSSAVISGHQRSSTVTFTLTFTLSSDAGRRLRSTRPVFGFMREQRSDRSNEGGTQSTLSQGGHQRSSTVISNNDSGSTFEALEGLLSHMKL